MSEKLIPEPTLLDLQSITAGYEKVAELYPHIPPLSMWRAWEYAAYQRFQLTEPVLDLGCGDGHFFRMLWPDIVDVVGVDIDPSMLKKARESGIYKEVHNVPAHELPFEPESFGSVFANCSIEHMDHRQKVFENVRRCIKPGGRFLFSAVTDKLVEWSRFEPLVNLIDCPERTDALHRTWEAFHNLVSPLPPKEWAQSLQRAGFEVESFIPLIPQPLAGVFLIFDRLWNAGVGEERIGLILHQYLVQLPDFPQHFGSILERLIQMSPEPQIGAGIVLLAKPIGPLPQPVKITVPEMELQPASEAVQTQCWCGNAEDFEPFSPEYVKCGNCGSLVSLVPLRGEELKVQDDAQDYYGKEYWESHQEEMGYPDIRKRAQNDLSERNLYWLRTLLEYKLPPGKTLELGSAHGSFVAMLQMAGFDAAGLDLSPEVVKFAKETFQIPVYLGPLEEQDIEPGTLDVIAMMDVLEHFIDPIAALKRCLMLLKPDGIFLIQTPLYKGGEYDKLLADGDIFLDHLKSKVHEHPYIFNEQALKMLFEYVGVENIRFLPPIFSYDAYFVASKGILNHLTPSQRDRALKQRPGGRMALAMLKLYEDAESLQQAADERLNVIGQLQQAADERLDVIEELQQAADERLRIIKQLQQNIGSKPFLQKLRDLFK